MVPSTPVLILLAGLLCTSIHCLHVEVNHVEKIPMYDRQEIEVQLVMDEEDREVWESLEIITLTANLSDTDSWAVNILNDSLTFSYDDRR